MNSTAELQVEPTTATATEATPAAPSLLQRACACGQHAIAGGECEACRAKRLDVQPKLTVSRPGDAHEEEAERLADAVMRTPAKPVPGIAAPWSPESEREPEDVDRQPDEEERREDEDDDEDEEQLYPSAGPGTAPAAVPGDVGARLESQHSGGEPLPAGARAFFEPRFGHDLGDVRVHADAEAGALATSLHALAFTREQHIFFAPGRYQPHTGSGRHLLAHELAHTLQQRRGSVPRESVDRRVRPESSASATLDAAPAPASAEGASPAPTAPAAPAAPAALEAAPGAPGEPPAPAGRRTAAERAAGAAAEAVPAGPAPGAGAEPAATAGEVPATEGDGTTAVPEQPVLDTSSEAGLLQSLATVPLSAFSTATTQAEQAAAELQASERVELADSLPEIERPTGLPRLSERPAHEAPEVPEGQAPEPETPGPREEPPPDTTHEEARGPLPAAQVQTHVDEPADDEEGESWWEWITGAVRRFLRQLPTADPTLDTSAGERPRVDTSGDADPAQNARQRGESDAEVTARRTDADQATRGDFGENDIYPDVPGGTMRATYAPGSPRGGAAAGAREAGGISPVVRAGFDRAGGGWLAGEVGDRAEQEQQDRLRYETESEEERRDTQTSIDDETRRIRGEQEDAQTTARREVTDQRDSWREENRRIQETYGGSVATRSAETTRQIEGRITSTEAQADEELSRAESQAEDKRRDTERLAAEKKREADNRPRSFWDRVKGAVSDFFDALKEAVNAIFDAARRFVRGLIERAKRLVRDWIEAARRAIVGLIRGFGEFLKGAVSLVLIAFPETAQRARRFIDDKVEGAVETVNEAAAALQDFAQRALDALGAALDAILAFYQAAYSLIIDGLKFLAVGLVELMEKISYLVEAAGQMPDHFLGQVSEELIGQDLTQPLPFELTEPRSPAGAVTAAVGAGQLASEAAGLLTSTSVGEGDVVVDQVAPLDLDQEFLATLALQDGEEREFGENNDPSRTLSAVQDELSGAAEVGPPPAPGAEVVPAEPAAMQPEAAPPEAASAEPAAAEAAAPAEELTPEQEADRRLDAMLAVEPEPPCPKEASADRAGPSAIPEEQKFGPLTVGQRASYLTRQMIKGVRNWFSCNWPWLLAAAIGVLTVLIIAEILTGGAITAALPPLMQLIAMIMLGVAAVRVALWVGEYLEKGWGGDIPGAAKSLARGLAVGAIELVFTLLFDLNAVLKAARQGLTATLRAGLATARTAGRTLARSGMRLGRAAVRTARHPGRAAALVGRVSLRRGRIVMQGLRRGFGRGVRSLDDLARRLWHTVRFRRFKLIRRGRRIQLWGYINPWVLMADGELLQTPTTGGRPTLGHTYEVGRRRGILVGVRDEPSEVVSELALLTPAQRRTMYRNLRGLDEDGIRAILINRETTAELRRGISTAKPLYFNAHHIVPRELRGNQRIRAFLDEIGFHWEDGARNGVMLPPSRALAQAHPPWAKASLHFTSHPGYTRRVQTRLLTLEQAYRTAIARGVSPTTARTAALQSLDTYLARLRTGLMNGTVPLN